MKKGGTSMQTILAIETSCDDTCIAIIEVKKLKNSVSFKILSNVVQTQTIHNQYGGVFPALAKREHLQNIGPVYEKAVKDAEKSKKNLKFDAIAVTVGPGLEPALWVGITFAKELGEKLNIPVIPVNHMEGHIYSIFPQKGRSFTVNINNKMFPVLSLLVSGGHTELVVSDNFDKYKIIGSTRDDACGEAFDKVARMLELPYPGGPEISRLAHDERRYSVPRSFSQRDGARGAIFQQENMRASGNTISSKPEFPRPMIHSKDYDFSFSGLKTAVLYYIRDHGPLTDDLRSKIAREFEDAVVDVLVFKTLRAIKEYKIKNLIVGGGVSANKYLKTVLKKSLRKLAPKTPIHFPVKNLTSDNALMIAIAGYFQYQKNKNKKSFLLQAKGNLTL